MNNIFFWIAVTLLWLVAATIYMHETNFPISGGGAYLPRPEIITLSGG